MFIIKAQGPRNDNVKTLEIHLQKYFKSISKKILEFEVWQKSYKAIQKDLNCLLASPNIMGPMFKHASFLFFKKWCNSTELKPILLIYIITTDEWINRNWRIGHNVQFSINWTHSANSLKEICLEELKEIFITNNKITQIYNKDKASKLGLPRVLLQDLYDLFE